MTDTNADIIALWPHIRSLAEDLGVKEASVRKWKDRDSIPAEYWLPLVAAAERRGIPGVTLELLAQIAAHKSTPSEAA